jgi:uncharacterized membrane protein
MLAADVDVIVFRILHIAAGVMWVGSIFLFVFFIRPTAAAIAPAGAPFMAELLGRRRMVQWLLAFAIVTILAGAYLYWKGWDAAGGLGDWLDSSFGLTLTIGGVAAFIAFLIGLFGTRPAVERMLAIGREAAAAGGPTAEQAAALAAIQQQLKGYAIASFSLLAVAVLTMAVARYV